MGLFFSRFRRKQTTNEILEDIDKEISRLQRNRKVNQNRQKQFVTSLLIYSITAYVIAAVVFFCVCFPETWQLRLIYSLPLLIFPLVVWGLKKSLHWYFVHRISSNDTELQDLRDRKNQILEDVMETETYKRAREILVKHDPEKLRKLEGLPEAVHQDEGTTGTVIQQRTVRTAEQIPKRVPGQQLSRPGPPSVIQEQNGSTYTPPPVSHQGLPSSQPMATVLPAQPAMGGAYPLPFRPPMARSILPRERGTMDKLMDYLVGDGPENRYALICWQCFSHNGMALKEEFEYLSFRCCYCYTINPARKQRPTAPRLEFFAPPGQTRSVISDSFESSEESNSSDADKEENFNGSRDKNSLKSDSSKNNSQELEVISTSLSHSSLPDTATTSHTEESQELVETTDKELEFEETKLDDETTQPNSNKSEDEGPTSHESEDKRLITGDSEPTIQQQVEQEPLFHEVI